jgi:hypothetical protein
VRRPLIALSVLTLLAGCTSRFDIGGGEWAKPGAAIAQITQDEMECARQAVDDRPYPETIAGGLADLAVAKYQDVRMSVVFDRCMAAKGYRPARG